MKTPSPDGHVRDANSGRDGIACTAVAGHAASSCRAIVANGDI